MTIVTVMATAPRRAITVIVAGTTGARTPGLRPARLTGAPPKSNIALITSQTGTTSAPVTAPIPAVVRARRPITTAAMRIAT